MNGIPKVNSKSTKIKKQTCVCLAAVVKSSDFETSLIFVKKCSGSSRVVINRFIDSLKIKNLNY